MNIKKINNESRDMHHFRLLVLFLFLGLRLDLRRRRPPWFIISLFCFLAKMCDARLLFLSM